MKKQLFKLTVVAIIVAFSSCSGGSGGFESDVRKAAQMGCDMQQLQKKVMAGDEKAKTEIEKLAKEAEAFAEKMKKKYEKMKDDKEMDEKADKIMDEVMANCK